MNIGFPDVCLTPAAPAPIPVPYPNMAMHAMASPFAATVKVSMMNALNVGAQVPMTTGDEPGSASPNKGPGRYTMGNPIVHVEGLPAINLLCPTTGNNMVNGLGAVVVPAVTNVFFSRALAPDRLADPCALAAVISASKEVNPVRRLDGDIGYVSIPAFETGVAARVFSAVERSGGAALSALLLDLRGNHGGELHAALELLGDFIEPGQLLATLVEADGDEMACRARGAFRYRFPLVVLVDGGTASAAEVFAGALAFHGRALIVGERTFGKGTCHSFQARPGGGADYSVFARVLLPDGTPIEGVGIQPTIELDFGDTQAT